MKLILITKSGDQEQTVSIDADAEDTAFTLDLLGFMREDFETAEEETTLQ